ncbi:hypothetical protein PVT71_23070 (plasmid) [Salipiger sp. H15]|uniref:CobQ/CobB/MinD/ParA nucleotide binding domain-containing protein n=1 Tax=Alloyangia sp. H15 TaxID=3029062 RepID=A0AAU8ARF7_9RHOB
MNADSRGSGFKRPANDAMAPPEPMVLDAADLDFGILFRLFRRRFLSIAALMLLFTALTLPFILSLEHRYTAFAQVLVTPTVVSGIVTRPEEFDLDKEVQRIAARANIETAIDRLQLDRLPEFNPALRPPAPGAQLRAALGLAAPPRKATDTTGLMILSNVSGARSVYRIGVSSVIQVAFASRDPELAAAVVTEIVDAYRARRNDLGKEELRAARDWLTQRRAELEQRLETAQGELRSFRESAQVAAGQGPSEAALRLEALTARQDDLQARRAALRDAMAAVETPDPETAGPTSEEQFPLLSQMLRDLAAKEGTLANLRQVYGENYAAVAALSSETRALREQIAAQVAVNRAVLTARLGFVEEETGQVSRLIDETRQTVTRDSAAEAELSTMTDEVAGLGTTIAELDGQIQALSTQLSFNAVDIEVLTPATEPLWPDTHSKKYYLAIAIVSSALLALTLVAFRELLDTRVRRLAELAPALKLTDAGMLPKLSAERRKLPGGLGTGDAPGFYGDAVRQLLATIEAESGERPLRRLLVTSTRAGEGKTTIATALALALRARGQRVLIVTCDTGTGATVPAAPGGEPADLAARITRDPATGIERLGRDRPGVGFFPDPAERAALDALAEAGEVTVILDAPPVLSGASARLPEGLSDTCLIVIRWSRTPRRLVELAVERLRPGDCTRVLAVVNAVDYRRQALYGTADAPVFKELAKASAT